MNKIDLEGRVAIVTGGASGLGLAIAELMAQSGAHCVIWDCNPDALQALPKALQGPTAFKVDISDLRAVEDAAESTRGGRHGGRSSGRLGASSSTRTA